MKKNIFIMCKSSASYKNTILTKPKLTPVNNTGIINNKNKTSKIVIKLEEVEKKLKQEN